MSPYHTDDTPPCSNAELLAHVRPSKPALPSYNSSDAFYFSLNPNIAGHMAGDEESHCGFWGENNCFEYERRVPRLITARHENHGFYFFCTLVFSVFYCLTCGITMIFGFDLILTRFGLGIGVAKWVVLEGHLSYDMHFCLASANRQAPGPQTWRYMSPNDIAGCTNEILTLSASSTEQWKLRFGDKNIFGQDKGHSNFDERMHTSKSRMENPGDDPAGEGTDRALDVYSRKYNIH